MKQLKVIGILILIAGAISTALSYTSIRALVNLTLPTALSDNYLFFGGIVLVVIGAFLGLGKKGSKQSPEVPIYEGHGKNRRIIGYQRMK